MTFLVQFRRFRHGVPEVVRTLSFVGLDEPRGEPQYAIRSADRSYDRIVREHELREDPGARVRGR